MTRPLVGVIGSAIGNDPFDRRSWSGSSFYFFSEMKRRSIIREALGVVAPKPLRYFYMAKNIHRDRSKWKNRVSLDLGYRNVLTKSLRTQLAGKHVGSDVIQIGGYFDGPSVSSGRNFAYYDGNLTSRVSSGYALGVSERSILNAVQYERNLLSRMDRVFTFSDYLRESFIRDYYVPEEKVFTIGGGINIDRIPDLVANKDYCKKEILFIGIDFKRKGGPDVLEAFRGVRCKHPSARLHIVGPTDLEISENLSKGVVNHGFLDRSSPEMSSLFRECVLFVMPSLFEPFGIAPLEAMVHQIPAIVTNQWAFKEMVKAGENGALVERSNPEQLEDTLLKLLADPDLLRSMGASGRETVLSRYTWEAVVTRLEAAISNI